MKYQLVDTNVTDERGRRIDPRLVMGGKTFDTKDDARAYAMELFDTMDGIELIETNE